MAEVVGPRAPRRSRSHPRSPPVLPPSPANAARQTGTPACSDRSSAFKETLSQVFIFAATKQPQTPLQVGGVHHAGVIIGADENFARLAALAGAHNSVGLHDLNEARGARVTQLHAALQIRRRGLTGGQDDADRLVVFRIGEVLHSVGAGLLLDRLRYFLD